MNDRRKRPLGITLLALPFLWIGCLGTIFFPVILLNGGLSQLGDLLSSDHIQSEALRTALTAVISVSWFAAYVLYACIGFGLWKLRSWAWRAIVIVHWIGVAIAIIGGAVAANVLMKQPLLVIPFELGFIIPIAAVLWYLHRPHVPAAFGRTRPADTTTTAVPTRRRFQSGDRTWLKVTIAVICGFALFGGSLVFGIESFFRSSTVYAMTLKAAQQSPCLIGRLGTPITAKGLISGNMTESNSDGSADLEIPMVGPKGKGQLQLSAKKAAGSWEITSLVLEEEDEKLQLIPAAESPGCH